MKLKRILIAFAVVEALFLGFAVLRMLDKKSL